MNSNSSNKFEIRAIKSNDYPQWLTLWEGYNEFYGREGSTALPEKITKKTWNRFLDDAEPVYALVAECEGGLLGMAHYIFHRSTTMLSTTCYLQDLFTVESARGQGVGRALIDSVCQRAKEIGSARVYWQTHESNQNAMKLYDKVAERSGFLVYRINLESHE